MANDLGAAHGGRRFGLPFPPEFGDELKLNLDGFATTADEFPLSESATLSLIQMGRASTNA